MITIDGAMGEGGGQIVRTSVALSAVTGRPVTLENIRARRRKPGLLRQHLTGVNAVASVCGGRLAGADLGSRRLSLHPGPVRGGKHHFSVGTAGSANLVLQTLLPPLMVADGPSEVVVEGGTHNPMSPTFHFLRDAFAPALLRAGPGLELELDRWGFYPAGGGRIRARVQPVARLSVGDWTERGALLGIEPVSVISAIPRNIAHRELNTVCKVLGIDRREGRQVQLENPRGPGNVLLVTLRFEGATMVISAFGEKRKSSEQVAEEAAIAAQRFLDAEVPVDEHLADQLLIPMAMAGGGRMLTTKPTGHTLTNIQVIERFLNVRFSVTERDRGRFEVAVGPR
jgi:RNA 3'-terminal phosphate cyclase (ATP)